MKIKEHYALNPNQSKTVFWFESIGPKGVILKWIWFQWVRHNVYNLAFGDLRDGKYDDKVISNNQDFVKVLSTVAKAIQEFFELHPDATIEIEGVDEKRSWLYNVIFQRRHDEIAELFHVEGVLEEGKEKYNPDKVYGKFELRRKEQSF